MVQKIEKFSSLHDDLQTPLEKHKAGVGEWKDFPHTKWDPKDKSTLLRLSQYGVNLEEEGINPHNITEERYVELVVGALRARYELVFGSVFDPASMSIEVGDLGKRLAYTAKMCDEYRRWGVKTIDQGSDVNRQAPNVLVSLEGADHITSIADAKRLVEAGVRCFGLQYGKDNPLALNAEGLTQDGRKVLRWLFDQGIPIDLAHSSLKVRTDVLDLADQEGTSNLIIYTHGGITEDVDLAWASKVGENRLLKPEEVKRIIRGGGIIGLGVTKPFFGSIEKIAERIDKVAQIDGGINHLGVGSDFGGVWQDLMIGIESIEDLNKIADQLSTRFSINDDQIEQVLRTNATNWVAHNLKQ